MSRDLQLRQAMRRFDRAAATFDRADFVHRATADGLLERLAPVAIDAGRVLELGSATGTLSRKLARRFRGSRILSLDVSHAMLLRARRAHWRYSRVSELQADASALPLPDGSVDVVVANQLLPFVRDPSRLLGEVARVLRPEGLFAFASLGPDSLRELRLAWGHGAESARFADMHDVGDALIRAGLRDPVLDVDTLVVEYREPAGVYRDLELCGGRGPLADAAAGLAGRGRRRQADERLEAALAGGSLRVGLELVYGHAFGGGPRPRAGEFHVDVGNIGRRRRTP